MPERRLSMQLQQEEVSRNQVAARLSEYGWICGRVDPDLGEDDLVRIYDDGHWSGLSFYAQVKSVTTGTHKVLRDGTISQVIEVKDLFQWERSAVPVVLVVWNVDTNSGHWGEVAKEIRRLDSAKPSWRTQTTVRCHLGSEDLLSDDGLAELRRRIVDHCLPGMLKTKPLEIRVELSFPDTAEGRSEREAFLEAQATGAQYELHGPALSAAEISSWYKAVTGMPDYDPEQGKLVLGPSVSDYRAPMRFDMDCLDGSSYSIPYIDYRAVQVGSEEATLSNLHQVGVPKGRFVLSRRRKEFDWKPDFSSPGVDVVESREILRLLDSMAVGGAFILTMLELGGRFEGVIAGGQIERVESDMMRLLDAACTIQRAIGQQLRLPSWELSGEDIAAIRRVELIVTQGFLSPRTDDTLGTVDITVTVQGLKRIVRDLPNGAFFTKPMPPEPIMLLGRSIDFGPRRMHVVIDPDQDTSTLQAMAEDSSTAVEVCITLDVAAARIEYPDWLPRSGDAPSLRAP